jgi:CRP-like cAMP-binding protein
VVFERGAPATAAVVVAQGRVECSVETEGGRRWVRAVLSQGGTWGLPAVIDGQPYGCTARAVGATRLVIIPAVRIRDLMEEDRRFALAAMRLLTEELRRMVHYASDVTLHTVRQRLANYLLQRMDSSGRLRLDAPQARIASEIGTVREVVARLLRTIEREGLISREGRTIRVLQPDALLPGDTLTPLLEPDSGAPTHE